MGSTNASSVLQVGLRLVWFFSQASTIFKKSQSTNFNYGAFTKLASVNFYQYAPNSSANWSSADWLMLFGEYLEDNRHEWILHFFWSNLTQTNPQAIYWLASARKILVVRKQIYNSSPVSSLCLSSSNCTCCSDTLDKQNKPKNFKNHAADLGPVLVDTCFLNRRLTDMPTSKHNMATFLAQGQAFFIEIQVHLPQLLHRHFYTNYISHMRFAFWQTIVCIGSI